MTKQWNEDVSGVMTEDITTSVSVMNEIDTVHQVRGLIQERVQKLQENVSLPDQHLRLVRRMHLPEGESRTPSDSFFQQPTMAVPVDPTAEGICDKCRTILEGRPVDLIGEVLSEVEISNDFRNDLADCMRETCLESVRTLVAAVEAKDPYTKRHSVAVCEYSTVIAHSMNLDRRSIESIETAAILHDIGKIGVPDDILLKPGPLSMTEAAIVRKHPEMAIHILNHTSFLREELPLILHHHEWYDGGGYPLKLRGESIPLGARILAVADALDTMFSRRSYKQAQDVEYVCRELWRNAGKQFDPDVVDVTLEWLHKMTPLHLQDDE